MAWSLPKLPGNTFQDPTRTQHYVPRKFEMINGFMMPRMDTRGVGGIPMDIDGTGCLDVSDTCSYDPSLTYGRVKQIDFPVTLPTWVHYDKKKLSFRGFLRQSVPESPLEYFRIRPIVLVYFLEDDTMLIAEPGIENSGLWHGKLVKRGKIPKNDDEEYWHWKDLNVGIDIPVFGKVFHLTSCDDFTKEFLESQGVELAEEELLPDDPCTTAKQLKKMHSTRKVEKRKETLKRFLQYDGKVLKFDAVWDDTETKFGEIRPCQIFYHLVDDMISVKECHTKNNGRDPVPSLLRKMRVPRNWKDRTLDAPFIVHEPVVTQSNEQEFFRPEDLVVGTTVYILGRPFLIFDCDLFTRSFYREVLNIDQPPKIFRPESELQHKERESLRESCQEEPLIQDGFLVEPVAQDAVLMSLNANKKLRYICEMVPMHPEDKGRQFVLAYHLANGCMKLDELAVRNSGFPAKCFCKLSRVKIPGTNRLYTPEMFYIGAIVVINQHKFKIIGCDLYVYNYMKDNSEKFPIHVVDSVRNYHLLQGNLKHDVRDATVELLNRKENPPEAVEFSDMDKCLQNLNVLERPSPPAEVPTVNYQECEEYQGKEICQLPKTLQGLQPVKRCDDMEEKPIVCFTGPAVSPRKNAGTNESFNGLSRGDPKAISQCKKVTFAEPPRKIF